MMLFAGNGRYDFSIVGESYRQAELAELAGPRQPEGCDIDCLAALIYDNANKHDPKAVAIFIGRHDGSWIHVGFLARKQAPRFRDAVRELGGPDPDGMLCRAKIRGGWDDGLGDTGMYGVNLDLHWPLKLRQSYAQPLSEKLI